jgi:hypothetical protein
LPFYRSNWPQDSDSEEEIDEDSDDDDNEDDDDDNEDADDDNDADDEVMRGIDEEDENMSGVIFKLESKLLYTRRREPLGSFGHSANGILSSILTVFFLEEVIISSSAD